MLLVIAMIVPTITSIFTNSTADGTVDVPEGRAEEYYEKYRKGFYGILLLTLTMLFGMTAQAKTDDTIKTGIYAGDVELSGMTAQEATAVIEEHIEGLKDVEITLLAANDHDVTTTAGDLGVTWKNPELVQEALELGTHGNVIERYKP